MRRQGLFIAMAAAKPVFRMLNRERPSNHFYGKNGAPEVSGIGVRTRSGLYAEVQKLLVFQIVAFRVRLEPFIEVRSNPASFL